jgi:hypothetical protein
LGWRSLLDSNHFLSARSDNSGSIQLYKLERSRSFENTPAVHLVTLLLPPLAFPTEIVGISMRTEPIMTHPLPHTPFRTNDEDRLHVFWIAYHRITQDDMDEVTECASLFVHQRVFTKYIKQQACLGGPPLDIPWKDWGPSNTQLFCLNDDSPPFINR